MPTNDTERCCGNCKWFGNLIWPDAHSHFCDYPLPEWMEGKLGHPLEMAILAADGGDCKAFQPKEVK